MAPSEGFLNFVPQLKLQLFKVSNLAFFKQPQKSQFFTPLKCCNFSQGSKLKKRSDGAICILISFQMIPQSYPQLQHTGLQGVCYSFQGGLAFNYALTCMSFIQSPCHLFSTKRSKVLSFLYYQVLFIPTWMFTSQKHILMALYHERSVFSKG